MPDYLSCLFYLICGPVRVIFVMYVLGCSLILSAIVPADIWDHISNCVTDLLIYSLKKLNLKFEILLHWYLS